ncbi:hypothetical protein DOY81_013049, partial [Sarcophaga bullata]
QKQQQKLSSSTTEKSETTEKDGAVVTTTTKVTTRTVTGSAAKPVSPFNKFNNLIHNNLQKYRLLVKISITFQHISGRFCLKNLKCVQCI